MIEQIGQNRSSATEFEQTMLSEHAKKKKLAKGFLNNAGIFVGVLLMFAVIVVVTTDIRLTSFEEIAALGLDFFLLLQEVRIASFTPEIRTAKGSTPAALEKAWNALRLN